MSKSSKHSAGGHRVPLFLPSKKGGYKHSIDPFLIADFVSEWKGTGMAADFCAGNGIIGALLARKYADFYVTGFEYQWSLAREGKELIRKNGLEKRVNVVCCDLLNAGKMIAPGAFDIVVGNPPYRRADDGRINSDRERAVARHELTITIDSFLKASFHALGHARSLFLIYHPYRLSGLFDKLKSNRLAPLRIRFVHSFPGAEAGMVMVEAKKNGKNDLRVEAPLFIYNEEKLYSEEVLSIYRGFGCALSGE